MLRLHHGGGLAVALRRGRPACTSRPFPEARRPGATTRWREKWDKVKRVRRVVTGALEIERAAKRIGSSLEAAPTVHHRGRADARLAPKRSTSTRWRSSQRSGSCPAPGRGGAFASTASRRRRGDGTGRRRQMRAFLALFRSRRRPIPPFRTSRRAMPRRCANGRRREAPFRRAADRAGRRRRGALCAFDQAHKLWMLFSFDIAARQPVALTPFLEMILIWNRGVSYGLFQQETEAGQWALVAFKIVAVIVLSIWLAARHRAWCHRSRTDHRRRRRQWHRSRCLRRRRRFLSLPRRKLQLVRVQHRRCRYCCGSRPAPV